VTDYLSVVRVWRNVVRKAFIPPKSLQETNKKAIVHPITNRPLIADALPVTNPNYSRLYPPVQLMEAFELNVLGDLPLSNIQAAFIVIVLLNLGCGLSESRHHKPFISSGPL
jgi:hypothetical protein